MRMPLLSILGIRNTTSTLVVITAIHSPRKVSATHVTSIGRTNQFLHQTALDTHSEHCWSFHLQRKHGLQMLPIMSARENHVGLSWNGDTPKSYILMGSSLINHAFGGTPIYGNTHICTQTHWGFLNKTCLWTTTQGRHSCSASQWQKSRSARRNVPWRAYGTEICNNPP